MRKTFNYKLYSSKRNKILHHKIGNASQIYNYCLAIHKTYYYCNEINEELTLKERDWVCPYCSEELMRDKNAARNIKRQGIVLWHRECKTYEKAIPA